MRHAVAEQQLHSFERCLVVFLSVDAQAAEFGLEEQIPPALERFPELFAQLRFSGEQIPQLLRCESNRFNAAFGFDRDDRGSPCKQIDTAAEVSGTVAYEHHAFARRDVDGSHRSRENYVAVERVIPGRDEWIIFGKGTPF